MEIVQDIEERLRDCRKGFWRDLGQEQSTMDNDSKEENPDWNRFRSYKPSADNPHEFGECMEDWHDYEWRKEQKEIDRRREVEARER